MHHDFWTKARAIRDSLAQPLHDRCIRNPGHVIDPAAEADLSHGFQLDIRDDVPACELETAFADFRTFLSVAMGIDEVPTGYPISVTQGRTQRCPADAAVAFEVRVSPEACLIVAADSHGVRRALIFLEDKMTARRCPALPLGHYARSTRVADRITRSPIAAYRFSTGWELLDDHDYYPDAYLNKLAHSGVNGIWVAGLFRNLIRTRSLPELGPVVDRLDKLEQLVERCKRYGIKVFFFCMEPRPVRIDHPVFKAHPEVRGARVGDTSACLCTSSPLVREYLREATRNLCLRIPDLGGLILIFNGERITNCWLSKAYASTCPRCAQRPQIDVVAEDLNCFIEGIRQAGSGAKCLAWTYWMNPDNALESNPIAPVLELIDKADPQIVWLSNFEHGGVKTIGDRTVPIDEYSLSYTGPSEPFAQVAARCRERGARAYAKLQVGTTFELSSLPWVPVPGVIYDKFKAMDERGVTGAMLNWMPGGFPSPMLRAAGMAAFSGASKQDFLHELASLYWPPADVPRAVQSWNALEKGFAEYPFTNRFFYFGPITRAPAYPLGLRPQPDPAHPYNWGIDRQRQPQPFEEDLARWFPPFTFDTIIRQLDRMVENCDAGAALCPAGSPGDGLSEATRQRAVADALAGHVRCTRNVVAFLVRRGRLAALPDEAAAALGGVFASTVAEMKSIVASQINEAERFKGYIANNPWIGYQSEILDFSYDADRIDLAIRANQQTLCELSGTPATILAAVRQSPTPSALPEELFDVDRLGD